MEKEGNFVHFEPDEPTTVGKILERYKNNEYIEGAKVEIIKGSLKGERATIVGEGPKGKILIKLEKDGLEISKPFESLEIVELSKKGWLKQSEKEQI